MSSENNIENQERTILLNRLLSRKDLILKASLEMERINQEYVSAGEKDLDGHLQMEAWQKVHTVISCLSELTAYAKGRSLDLQAYSLAFEQISMNHFLLGGDISRILFLFANSVEIKWDPKKGPLVNFKELNLANLHLKQP